MYKYMHLFLYFTLTENITVYDGRTFIILFYINHFCSTELKKTLKSMIIVIMQKIT